MPRDWRSKILEFIPSLAEQILPLSIPPNLPASIPKIPQTGNDGTPTWLKSKHQLKQQLCAINWFPKRQNWSFFIQSRGPCLVFKAIFQRVKNQLEGIHSRVLRRFHRALSWFGLIPASRFCPSWGGNPSQSFPILSGCQSPDRVAQKRRAVRLKLGDEAGPEQSLLQEHKPKIFSVPHTPEGLKTLWQGNRSRFDSKSERWKVAGDGLRNHRMILVGKTLRDHRVQPVPNPHLCHPALSSPSILRDGNSKPL